MRQGRRRRRKGSREKGRRRRKGRSQGKPRGLQTEQHQFLLRGRNPRNDPRNEDENKRGMVEPQIGRASCRERV